MSSLVAINYESRGTAEEVRATLARLQTEHAIALEDVVIVEPKEDGKVKLHQPSPRSRGGGGAAWGGLIGLIFFVPLFGMASAPPLARPRGPLRSRHRRHPASRPSRRR